MGMAATEQLFFTSTGLHGVERQGRLIPFTEAEGSGADPLFGPSKESIDEFDDGSHRTMIGGQEVMTRCH